MDLLTWHLIYLTETITRGPLIKQIMPNESLKWLPGQPFPSSQLGVNWVLTWMSRRKLVNFQEKKWNSKYARVLNYDWIIIACVLAFMPLQILWNTAIPGKVSMFKIPGHNESEHSCVNSPSLLWHLYKDLGKTFVQVTWVTAADISLAWLTPKLSKLYPWGTLTSTPFVLNLLYQTLPKEFQIQK